MYMSEICLGVLYIYRYCQVTRTTVPARICVVVTTAFEPRVLWNERQDGSVLRFLVLIVSLSFCPTVSHPDIWLYGGTWCTL
jgi:hypothetical protein